MADSIQIQNSKKNPMVINPSYDINAKVRAASFEFIKEELATSKDFYLVKLPEGAGRLLSIQIMFDGLLENQETKIILERIDPKDELCLEDKIIKDPLILNRVGDYYLNINIKYKSNSGLYLKLQFLEPVVSTSKLIGYVFYAID